MGILDSGIFGGFRKKTGPVIGRRSKGQNIVTALHHESTKPVTTNQLDVQYKFASLNKFFKVVKALVNLGFAKYVKHNTPCNAAYTYNYDHAFLWQDEAWVLNYPKLVYSRGHIAGPNAGQVTMLALETGYKVQFNWLPQAQSLYCQFTDKASFLVYHPAKKRAFVRSKLALRSDLSYEVLLAGVAENEELHCYMSFASADGKLQGNSFYLGSLVSGA